MTTSLVHQYQCAACEDTLCPPLLVISSRRLTGHIYANHTQHKHRSGLQLIITGTRLTLNLRANYWVHLLKVHTILTNLSITIFMYIVVSSVEVNLSIPSSI